MIKNDFYFLYYYLYQSMWKLLKGWQGHSGGSESEEDPVKIARQLQLKIEQNMHKLSNQLTKSQYFLDVYCHVSPKQQSLNENFQQMMAALEGLIGIIGQLISECNKNKQEMQELVRLRGILGSHNEIVKTLQEQHSNQIQKIYQQYQQKQKPLQNDVANLNNENLIKSQNIKELTAKLIISQDKIRDLQQQSIIIKKQRQILRLKLEQITLKYQILQNPKKQPTVFSGMNEIKFQYLFHSSKTRNCLLQFLDIVDLCRISQINHFIHSLVQPLSSQLIYKISTLKRQNQQQKQLSNLRQYQKIYQLFPPDNIRVNALKYLYFKLKPAAYILPYLQQDIQQQEKAPQGPKQSKFNWRSLFSQEKNKKQQKFNLNQLKNGDQYKKVQAKVQMAFKNVLQIELPDDLKYFSEVMQRQLSELKQGLELVKRGGGQEQWTAQLHCLCRFMYLQTSQLYNLLQVIFGQLVTRSRKLVMVNDRVEQLQQNQNILRNLIQQLSQSRSQAERKNVIVQNELLKQTLQSQSLGNTLAQIQKDNKLLKSQNENLLLEHKKIIKTLEKYQEDRRAIQFNFTKIREELILIENGPRKRKQSAGFQSAMMDKQEMQSSKD